MKDLSARTHAFIAGFFLLFMAVVAGYAYGFALNQLFVPGDAKATMQNLMSHSDLFRRAIFGFVLILISDLLVAWSLYYLLKPISSSLSLLSTLLRLIYVLFLAVAISCLLVLTLLTSGASFLSGLQTPGLMTLTLLGVNSFTEIWNVGLLIFGIHLVVLAGLVFRSSHIPKTLGVLLLLAGLAYLVGNTANLLWLDYKLYKVSVDKILAAPMAIGELAFAFWLLLRGGKE